MAEPTPAAADRAVPRALVEVRDASKHYGAVHALDGVTLDIVPGEVFGLIGHNGAGKSTLFKMMMGLIAPSSGTIRIDGVAVDGVDFREVRRRIGYLPENVVFYDNLNALETLHFFARLKGIGPSGHRALLERVGLGAAATRRIREYSKGMRQRLGFAQALLGQPRLLFLDEPTNGLDPDGIREFYAILAELRADGVTIVLTSHILAEIQQRVDRLAIIAAGRVRAVGALGELRGQADLPLWFDIDCEAAVVPALRAALASLPATVHEVGAGLRIACARQHKLAVLQAVGGLAARLRDFQVREASLEDLFFGLSS
ncbi:MAG: ABC transporter ATP-binding protein [Proteobacteria bacterium]|nr:ABC transporter ATP-binding protein [Pseudomonadota bacterium]MBK8958770.1 ABC transporter ATP-binding protein [Pseudomonadota bacterium]